MKTKLKLVIVLSALATVSAYANCDTASIDGTWVRSESYADSVDSGKSWTYEINGASVKETIALTDSWTATGTYGPYYAKEIDLIATYGTNCSVKLTEISSVTRSFRNFDEPTANLSEEHENASGRVSRYSFSVNGDELSLTDLRNDTIRLHRKN